MNRVVLKDIPLQPKPFPGLVPTIHRVFFGLFLLQFALVWTRVWLPQPPFGTAHWPEGLLVLLAAATVLASLTRQLPGQNVMLASIIIAFIASAVETLGALTGIPLFVHTNEVGPQLAPSLPWEMPLAWIVALLSSRGVARMMLRPWRNTPNYGFWLIGLTIFLVVLLDFGVEPFAGHLASFWRWTPSRVRLDWHTASCVNFLGCAVTALLILAFVTPTLINKKPMTQPPPDYHPLIVWLLLNLLFATGTAAHQLWPAAILTFTGSVVVMALAVRGVQRQKTMEMPR